MEDRIQTPTTDQSPSPLTNTNNILAYGPQFGNYGNERLDNIFSAGPGSSGGKTMTYKGLFSVG